jgi:phytoene dehydrogenase-like protein
VARAVRDLALKHGAQIETGVTVARLETAGRRFVAAITADGRRVAADAGVAAVDAGMTARWIDSADRERAGEPAYAARVAWWVVEGASRESVHHAFHFGDEEHPAYVAVPTVTDPALASAGASIVYSLLHGRPGTPAGPAFAEAMQGRLVRTAAWPGGRVLAHGVAGGSQSCYGGAIGPGLFASFRPSQRTRVPNLVRAGGSVFPGPGIANVLRSALRAATLVADRLRP